MIFDFLDGFSARLLEAYSSIGKELDSLADIVSFGVAPAVIIYQLISKVSGMNISETNNITSILILITPVLMPVFAGLRLAIFNTDESQANTFKGLPTPANALAVISIIIAGSYTEEGLGNFITGSVTGLVLLTLILSILMVTKIPMLSLKFHNLKLKGNETRYILIALVILTLTVWGLGAAALIIPIYIIVSLISWIFQQ